MDINSDSGCIVAAYFCIASGCSGSPWLSEEVILVVVVSSVDAEGPQ